MRVEGAADLRRVAAQLRKAGLRDLEKELGKAITKAAGKRVKPAVVERAGSMMPSGYAPVLAPALSMRTSTSTRRGLVTIRVKADGQRELRDVAAIDRGILRHPLFGIRRRWFVTTVPQSFASGALEQTADQVAEDVGEAIETTLSKIGGR